MTKRENIPRATGAKPHSKKKPALRSGPRGAQSHLTERIKPAPRHRRENQLKEKTSPASGLCGAHSHLTERKNQPRATGAQKQKGQKMFTAKQFAGTHCGCRYQQDYRPTLGKDGKKESGTLEVIKFYYDGAIRMEQHCYGEAATFVFGVWAEGMDADGTLHWALPDRRKSYYDEEYLPRKLDRVDEAGDLYFDGSPFPWKLADDFDEDKRWGYPKWKVLLGKLTGKGRKCD